MARRRAIANLAVSVTARTKKFVSAMKKLRKSVAKFAVSIKRMAKRVAKFGLALTAVAVGAFALMIKNSFKTIDALGKTGQRLGIATDKLAGLQLAAKLAGISVQTFEMSLQRLGRRVGEAAVGMGEAQEAIKTLGLDARELIKVPLDKQLRIIKRAILAVDNQFERLRLAMKLFDSEGVKNLNILQDTGMSLEEIQKLAERFGTALSGSAVAAITETNNAFTLLKEKLKGIADQLSVKIAPLLTVAINKLVALGTTGRNAAETIFEAMKFVVREAFRALDVLSFMRAGFLGVKLIALESLGAIAKAYFGMLEKLFRLLRKIPGLSANASLALAEIGAIGGSLAFQEAIDKTNKQIAHQLSLGLPSQRAFDVFDNFVRKMQEAAEKLEGPKAALGLVGATAGADMAVKTAAFKQVNLSRFAISALAGLRGKVQTVKDPQALVVLKQILAKPTLAVVG